MQNLKLKIILLSITTLALPLFIAGRPDRFSPALAQSPICQQDSSLLARAEGLVSTPNLRGIFSSTIGQCVVGDPKASLVPFQIPTFDNLKSIFYDQAKPTPTVTKHRPLTGDKTHADILLTGSTDHLYHVNGNLILSGDISGNRVGVIFVDGNLMIDQNITTLVPRGLVLVVKGKVNINPQVTRVEAVLIVDGAGNIVGIPSTPLAYSICTSLNSDPSNPCPYTPSDKFVPDSQPLVIEGSLISLNPDYPIQFRRKLRNDSLPAEVINYQPKYLVLLKDLFSENLRVWKEIY